MGRAGVQARFTLVVDDNRRALSQPLLKIVGIDWRVAGQRQQQARTIRCCDSKALFLHVRQVTTRLLAPAHWPTFAAAKP
jgi:hypothetical protein